MKWTFLLLLNVSFLTAGIEDYLKPVGDKRGQKSIFHVDCTYLINLDERPEKLQDSLLRLQPYDIVPCRFSAVNGWKLSTRTINKLGITYKPSHPQGLYGVYYDEKGRDHHEVVSVPGRVYFSCNMSRGAIGVALSHLSILQDAYKAGYQTIWIMEDDIEVIQSPHLLSLFIKRLDGLVGNGNWDILYTDQESKTRDGKSLSCSSFGLRPNFIPKHTDRFAKHKTVGGEFRRIGARYGTYSMILRRSGIKKILTFLKKYKLYLPYDQDLLLAPDLKLYTVVQDVVSTQANAASDNWSPGYK